MEKVVAVEVNDLQRGFRFDEGALFVLFALEDKQQIRFELVDQRIECGDLLARLDMADLLCRLDVHESGLGEKIAQPALLAKGVGHAGAGGEEQHLFAVAFYLTCEPLPLTMKIGDLRLNVADMRLTADESQVLLDLRHAGKTMQAKTAGFFGRHRGQFLGTGPVGGKQQFRLECGDQIGIRVEHAAGMGTVEGIVAADPDDTCLQFEPLQRLGDVGRLADDARAGLFG